VKDEEFRWRHVGPELRCRMKAAGLLNGCGPKGGMAGKFVPNRVLGLSVEESCDWHDFNYTVGGKEADRVKADWQFYESIRERAIKITSPWYRRWSRPFYCFVAWTYYRSVRLAGEPHFHYGIPRGREDMTRLLEEAEAKE